LDYKGADGENGTVHDTSIIKHTPTLLKALTVDEKLRGEKG